MALGQGAVTVVSRKLDSVEVVRFGWVVDPAMEDRPNWLPEVDVDTSVVLKLPHCTIVSTQKAVSK